MVGPLGSGQPAMPQQVLLLGPVDVFPCRALYIIRDRASESLYESGFFTTGRKELLTGRNELFLNLDKSARGRPEAKWFLSSANGFL